jgi:hypothetical protein
MNNTAISCSSKNDSLFYITIGCAAALLWPIWLICALWYHNWQVSLIDGGGFTFITGVGSIVFIASLIAITVGIIDYRHYLKMEQKPEIHTHIYPKPNWLWRGSLIAIFTVIGTCLIKIAFGVNLITIIKNIL